MTALRVSLVCMLALSLQLTVFVNVRIAGVAPELLAMVAILAGYFGGPLRGQAVAFGAGLLWDIYLPTHLGVSALIFAVAAYAIGSLEAGLFHDSRSQRAAVVAVATAAVVMAYALSNEILGVRGMLNVHLLKVAAVDGDLHLLCLADLYRFVHRHARAAIDHHRGMGSLGDAALWWPDTTHSPRHQLAGRSCHGRAADHHHCVQAAVDRSACRLIPVRPRAWLCLAECHPRHLHRHCRAHGSTLSHR